MMTELTERADSTKNKITNLKKYGVENVFQLKETKEKSKKTCLDKFGVEFYAQSEDMKTK